MRGLAGAVLLAIGVTAGAAAGYWYARPPAGVPAAEGMASAAERKILYYRDPSGAPNWSAEPKQDANGRDYLPVFEDEEISFEPGGKKPHIASQTRVNALVPAAGGPRKILYYRNPMGLPDTSPVPKKDWMGMDYIAVYEGEEQDDGKTVKVSLDKIQRSGVRTEVIEPRVIVRPVRAVGTVMHDESRLTIVTMRSDGFIEDLFVGRTGQHVHAGEPLFRVYSPDIQRAQIDLLVAMGTGQRGADAARTLEGALQRLRNLAVPESRIKEVRETGANPRTLDWPAPATGDVIEKKVINGQRVKAGDELYRIADHSHLWVIADVAEADLSAIKMGTRATVMVRAYMAQPIAGEVTFIYPELKAETRTARVRIEVPNPDGRLKVDMYADVVFQADAGEAPVIAVPVSAVIDSGTRQVVLVVKGEGRFEPRSVKLGVRGDGYVEVLDGVTKGEEVVTSATFLIDAESNLKAALQSFTQKDFTHPEASK
jgi:membrane fusion protein, copper/silver efflux system